jgi:hypothetical protein
MKITARLRRALRSGSSLLMTLVIITATLLVLAATLSRTVTTSKLNDRSNLYLVANAAAEAATEKVLTRMMVDFANGGLTALTNNMGLYQTNLLPNSSESPWWGNFTFYDGQSNANATYVGQTTTNANPPFVALQYQYPGLNAFAANYRVVSNVKPNFGGNYNFLSAVQQDVQMAEIPVFQFGVFYNGTLEFSDAAPMTLSGRVQCNTNIFVGSPSALTFNGFVTASGSITNPPMGGLSQGSWSGSVNYNGSPAPGWGTGEPVLNLPIGTNNSAASVLQILYPPPAGESTTNPISPQRFYNKAYLALTISNNGVWATVKSSMYDAGITFQTTNWVQWTTNNWTTWTVNAANSGTWFGSNAATCGSWYGITNWLKLFAYTSMNPNGSGITNFGTGNWNTNLVNIVNSIQNVSVTNSGTNLLNVNTNIALRDGRQSLPYRAVQIDVANLGYWVATNQICTNEWSSGNPFNGVLYVADWRTNVTGDAVFWNNGMNAVRLTNGATIYTNVTIAGTTYPAMTLGLTVATPNPLYVCSDYNCPVTAQLSTANVANTAPASFACDALTVLSTNWNDTQSFTSLTPCNGRHNAANTTVNAAIITGNVPSTGQSATTFSGGVHNLTRFLQSWSGVTLTLNSSIICLYASAQATNQFVMPTGNTSVDYYEPPTRQYYFNTNYLSSVGLPPGTPQVDRMIRATWCNPPPNTVTYSPWTNPIPYVPQ